MQRSLLMTPLAGLILVSAVQGQSLPTTAPAADEPRLTLSQESWDFGTARHLEKPELIVTLSNTGTAELHISKVSASCGCTAAQLEKYHLLPGESTPLTITFNTRGKRGKTGADVTIESNDKAAPKKVFHLEGDVKRALRIEPESAVFRLLGPDEAMSIPVHIISITEQPMELKLGPYACGKFAAELQEVRPGKEYDIVISTKPPITERVLADVLNVRTGLEDEPRLEIPTQVLQIDRVNFLQPAMLVTGDRRELVQSSAEIEYFGSDPDFRITKTECDDPHVSVQLSEPTPPDLDRPGRRPTSIVSLVADFPPQTVFPAAGLPIRVFTTDPEYPQITIYATPDITRYRDLTVSGRARSQRKAP